jgi:hypothetical protein
MIRLLTKIYIIVVTAPILIGAVSNSPTKIEITPFQVEIRSLYSSSEPEKLSMDLMSNTEKHITSFIESNKSNVLSGFQSISLFPEEEDMNSVLNRHRQMQDEGTRNLRSAVNFKVLYSGSILTTSDVDNLPSQKEIETIVLEAFIGQGKLDYIRSLRSSSDLFLSFTNYAKVWLPSESDNKSSSLSSDKLFLTIAIIAAVAVVMSITVALYYNCWRRGDEHTVAGAVATTKSTGVRDIRIAATRSMSQSPTNDKSSRPKYKSHQNRNIHSQRSLVTKSTTTFCADGSFDVIGWKSNGLNLNTPFETNISMISKSKTDNHILDVPHEIDGGRHSSRSSSAARLSKGMLSEHNKQNYGKRSSHRTRK